MCALPSDTQVDVNPVIRQPVENDKKSFRCRGWSLLFNTDYTVTHFSKDEMASAVNVFDKAIIPILSNNCKEYTYQWEIGNECGRLHLQGRIYFTHTKTKTAVLKIFGDWKDKWSVRPEKNPFALTKYCSKKDETFFMDGHSSDKKEKEKLKDFMDEHMNHLYAWQNHILDIIKDEPSRRKVHWFWEPNGNAGKSDFIRHLIIKHNALVVGGDRKDIKCQIADLIEKKRFNSKIIIMELMREDENNLSYGAIEAIKTCHFASSKFHGGMCIFNPVHLFVFSNAPPNMLKLSEDRWDIYDISLGHIPRPLSKGN